MSATDPFRQFSTSPDPWKVHQEAKVGSPSAILLDGEQKTNRGLAYSVDPMIEAAVDVALGLGRPLLVSGEPGTGKTELGYNIARRIGRGQVHFIACKSTTEATDLFYTYDAVRRFREAQLANVSLLGADAEVTRARARKALERAGKPGAYVTYRALGRAILEAHGSAETIRFLGELPYEGFPEHPRASVAVIDEIDKAPRDVCNDLLSEIEDLSFTVPELHRTEKLKPGSKLPAALRPVIVITSNAETQLPDAFLRRCVYLHLDFPDRNRLAEILKLHREADGNKDSGQDEPRLLDLFTELRKLNPEKKPGISELLDASRVLAADKSFPREPKERFQRLAGVLLKLNADRPLFKTALQSVRFA